MGLASISRSAFSRTGTVLTMKPGVNTLTVGTVDVTGIIINENYSIDVSSDELTFTNGNGTRTVTYLEDLISGGLIKPELMPDRALTQVYKPEDEPNLLLLDPVQIGDIAINQTNNISYVALNGDNISISDWEPIALASTHPAGLFISGDKDVLDNVKSHVDPMTTNNPHGTNLSNLSTVANGYTYVPHTSDKDEIGVASANDQKRLNKIVSKDISFGYTNNIEYKIPNADWTDIYNHLVGGVGNNSYEVALKSDIIPPGNTEPGYEDISTETGGLLQMGATGEILSNGTIATIQFYSKDPNLINIETNPTPDSDPRNNVTIPLSVHAEMKVEPEATITNPQTDTYGYGFVSMPDDNGSCDILEHLTKEACESAEGTWTPAPNDHNIFYQKDASVNFYTGRQTLLSNRFGMMHDGSLMLTSLEMTGNNSSRKPVPIQNYIKILANKSDNSLYYYTNDGSSDIEKRIVSSAVSIEEGEIVNFKEVHSDIISGTTISGNIEATTLKIDGVEVDLDNLITEFDYWSDSTNSLTITNTASNWDNDHVDEATGVITISQLGSLIPTDATLLDVVVLFRWRLTSNSDTENDNSLDSGTVQLKHSGGGTYNLLAGDGSNFSFTDESYYTPAGVSASGDMILRTCNVGDADDLETFKNYMSASSATFYLLLNDMKSNYNNLILRDFSWGIRLYWR